MTRYRLTPFVREADGEDLWVACVPDGPILRIGGAGAMVLDVLEGADPAAAVPGSVPGSVSGSVPGTPAGAVPAVDRDDPARDDELRPLLTTAEILAVLEASVPGLPEDAAATIEGFLAQLRAVGLVEAFDAAESGPA